MDMKYVKNIIFEMRKVLLFLSVLSLGMNGIEAQNLNSGYFLDGYTYRHELNPAFVGDSYISIPVMGQFHVGVRGNVGLENFLFNTPTYGLTTALNPEVSAQQFLGDLSDNNKLAINLKTTILSTGFKAFGGFNTIGVNFRMHTGVNIPYGLFEFAKRGMQGDTHYQLDNLSIRANGYVEMALGHARQINDNLSVGAKLKFLLGGADLDATMDEMDIRLSEERWLVRARARVNTSLKGARYTLDDDGLVDGIDVDSPGLGGFGMGLDLGASYKFTDGALKGLSLSASLLDLGFINWSENVVAYNHGDDFVFDGFHNVALDDDGEAHEIDEQLDDLQDDLEKLYNVHTDGKVGSRSTSLAATMNIGVEYALPAYDKLKFGFLSSTNFNDVFTWTEARFSANVNPVKWFGAGVNYAFSTYGSSLGLILNFHPKGFNFFVGTDCMLGDVNTQFIPLDSNASVTMGLNVIL